MPVKSASPKPGLGKAGAPARTPQLGSRVRVVLFALPLLFGWAVVYSRRFAPKAEVLPSTYALCSSPHQIQIYTLDRAQPWVECLVVRDGSLAHVGSLDDVRAKYGDRQTLGGKNGIKMYRMKRGQMALPGLIDSHAHMLQYGEGVHAADLVGAASVGEVVERLAKFVEANNEVNEDKSRFILGLGWDQTKWEGAQFPTAADLEADKRLAGRPIYLKRIDVHALWVSQTILDRLKSLPETVSGGKIVRDEGGTPTGVFLDNAMDIVTAIVPLWTDGDRTRFLTSAARAMLDTGLTSVHDAALTVEDIAFLKKVDQAGRLPIRIYGMASCAPLNSYCGEQVDRYDGDRFQLRAVKIFADGALGSRGAALHEDYSDDAGNRGIMISQEEEFSPLVKKWIDKGFQVNSHGIGDRANTVILDAYEASLPPNVEPASLRLRNEHTQILRPDDIARMGRLGVISSVQPTHATSDMAYAEQRLGPDRIKGAYAWQSLIGAGSRIALGSDFPVEQVNPFLGIYAAVTRKWLDGDSPHGTAGWFADQALSLEEALHGFTLGGAWASFQEDRVGSLEAGKEADFVVLDRNLFVVEESEIPLTEVRATVVGGRLFAGKLQ